METEIGWRATTFARKIARFFQNLLTPTSRKLTNGSIDSRNLSELAMKGSKYYYKKAKSKRFSGCAYFLMDNSGSMGYGHQSKRYFCCNALSIIEEGFKKFMPLKIVAFDAQGNNHVTHEVIKNWVERYSKNCSTNFLVKGRRGSGNKDGYSIRVATQELLTRSEQKRILFVLSDGTPSCYSGYGIGKADVEVAIREARERGIFVIGIFFSDSNDESEKIQFVNMYHTNCICTTPDKIDEEVIKIMKNFLHA